VPHPLDAIWNRGTSPFSLPRWTGPQPTERVGTLAPQPTGQRVGAFGPKPSPRVSALTRATAATVTVTAALVAAGSAPATPVPDHLAPAAPASPAQPPGPAAPPTLPAALAPIAARSLAVAVLPSEPLWPALTPNAPAPAEAAAQPTPAPVSAPPPPPSKGALALATAMSVRGTPYVWGGTGPRGFDCSGLMYWAFQKVGVALPRTSSAQSVIGQPVSRDQLQPGDLVFFYSSVSHVGIYVGDGMVLHAPQSGDVVKISPLSRMPFHNARRIT
jgi:cell wall-associated NlpC family hydrolase